MAAPIAANLGIAGGRGGGCGTTFRNSFNIKKKLISISINI
jgi:hypothetical protein